MVQTIPQITVQSIISEPSFTDFAFSPSRLKIEKLHKNKLHFMRLLLILSISVIYIVSSNCASAQTDAKPAHDTLWHNELVVGVNLSQVSFAHWEAGGTNSLAYLASVMGKSVRNDSTTTWTNTYKFAFGQTDLGGKGIQTSDDEIALESLLIYKIDSTINPYADVSLFTQFAPGYQYPDTGAKIEVSDFFDPAFIKESAGFGWTQSKAFQTRLGVGLREIITNNYNQYAADPNSPGVHKTRIEGGFESGSQLQLQLDDNVLFNAKLDLFAPIKTLDRIVVHGEASIVAKVSKYFSAQLNLAIINEPDISPYTQIQEGLSVGINYSIF
jgi:hypothetical protein